MAQGASWRRCAIAAFSDSARKSPGVSRGQVSRKARTPDLHERTGHRLISIRQETFLSGFNRGASFFHAASGASDDMLRLGPQQPVG